MLRRLVNFAGVIACVFLISRIPLAAQDTTPPVLRAFDFNPKTIDTTSGPASVTVTFTVDDPSGVSSFYVRFLSPSGAQYRTGGGGCTPGLTSCTASTDIAFPQFGESGIWTVEYVATSDSVGNGKGYFTADLLLMGLPTELTVNSIQDTTPPVLRAFDFNPKTIDTTSGPASVTVTFTVDDPSGVSSFYVRFLSPSGAQYRTGGGGCTPGLTSCTASTDIAFPQFGESGIWTVEYVATSDSVGNGKGYFTADLLLMGLPTELTVKSIQDTTPPILTAFEFNPKTIDTTSGPASVTVTFTVTDNLSGVSSFYVRFLSPSGAQYRTGGAGCTPGLTSCTASPDITFPQFGEDGIWTVEYVATSDLVGNGKGYYTADLAAMGLPTQLLITPLVVPELVFINAGAVPAGSKGKWSTVILQALVQNIGKLQASNVRVGFAYSIDGGLTFSNIGVSRAGTLVPGAAGTADYSWKTQPGEYLIQVTIDPDSRIAEYDETNNSGVFPLIVQ